MATIVAAIRQQVTEAKLPPGFFASLEGTFQAQEEASRTIAALSGLSLALVFAILYSRYRSAVLALIIMGNVPLALIGSVIALWLVGQPLSVASMIGFITLTGISARNGILKISHYLNLSLHEGMPFGRDLVVRGSLERLTPVLMTALSAGVALVPLLYDAANPGKEILHPVAVTIFGGLISATLLDTVLTPVPVSCALAGPRWSVCAPPRARLPTHPVRTAPSRVRSRRSERSHPEKGEDSMIPWRMTLIAGVLLALPVHAHEVSGQHGGRVTDAGKYHVELVAKGETVDVFVSDGSQKPVPAAGFKGTAILVVGGKPARVPLEPADGNRLSGKASVALGESPKGAVQLTAPDGATASGKFN